MTGAVRVFLPQREPPHTAAGMFTTWKSVDSVCMAGTRWDNDEGRLRVFNGDEIVGEFLPGQWTAVVRDIIPTN